jgi:hypothetical protein
MTTAEQLQKERATFNEEMARTLRCVESETLQYATMHLDNARMALENIKVLVGQAEGRK